MKQLYGERQHSKTAFVILNTKKCNACWECLKVCNNNVIGRINLPWHKHARFINISKCTGCFKCVKKCKTNAISKYNIE